MGGKQLKVPLPIWDCRVYRSLDHLQIAGFRPLTPPSLGGTESSKSPRIGRFRGLKGFQLELTRPVGEGFRVRAN